ncbi:hypothetical protein BGZ76_006179 [Entomortierella beljakovae]|nr:hypothetical protein BGZ76_006179 [Entomortierella beljakovae]
MTSIAEKYNNTTGPKPIESQNPITILNNLAYPLIFHMNYAQPSKVQSRLTKPLIIPPPIQASIRSPYEICSMSDTSNSGCSSPSSSSTNSSMESINLAVDQLRMITSTGSCQGVSLKTNNGRSAESKQRACRKKNQKRREAAKKNKALLSASPSPILSDSILSSLAISDYPDCITQPSFIMTPSTSVPDSSSITSEGTLSTAETTDPVTPATSFNSEPECEQPLNSSPLKALSSIPITEQSQDYQEIQDFNYEENDNASNKEQTEFDAKPLNEQQIEHEPVSSTTQIEELHSLDNPSLSSWDVASEHVATVALQCLENDKDMELSYVAVLSAINVLQSKQDQFQDYDESYEQNQYILQEKAKAAKQYSQIMKIMCRHTISEGLSKEILGQGIMAPDALYTQFYGSIQQAGYELEDYAHLSMAQYWIKHKNIEEAQDCLGRIEPLGWTGPVYRESITCLLLSKPRHIQEAESMLQKYLEFAVDSNETTKIKTWFKLQLDASKWEDVKVQYELRRTRLINGPSITDRPTKAAGLTPEALQQHQLQEQQDPSLLQPKYGRAKSVASSVTSSSHQRSHSGNQRLSSTHQRTPSVATAWPSGATTNSNSGTLTSTTASVTAPVRGALSFLSSLKFTKANETESSMSTSSALPSRLNVNHHLTVLDNGMLEESINYREFEYGWNQIYEKMGATLEDGETTRIAMRLCRQAFLGHNGIDSNNVGSPNLVNRDIRFYDGLDETVQDEGATSSKTKHGEVEIWEARAWAIYNKARLNSSLLPSNKTVKSQAQSSSVSGIKSQPGNTSDLSGKSSATPMSSFIHDILTIAIHSPEISSRYLKAFKVYGAIRSETQSQNLLRDPFVMTCMLKAIYDATQAVLHNPEQKFSSSPMTERDRDLKRHQRRSSSISLNRSQPMTLGPLLDLAFEIFADLRNIGPIRHLPALVTLTPNSPTGSKSKRLSGGSQTTQVSAPSEAGTASTVTISPRASFNVTNISVFQDLNPSLKPCSQVRHLPSEIYLALLHLCILTPIYRISSQVVRTIIADMTSSTGQPLYKMDLHLAAALQCYHDSWMTCPSSVEVEGEAENQKCHFYEWMYRSDESVNEQTLNDVGTNGGSKDLEDSVLSLDGEEQRSDETCNSNLYWDMWTESDTALQDIKFSKDKADMLWKHIAWALL